MKFKSLLSTAALALILASCAGEGTDSTKTASAPDSQAKADSLVYCFGQMRGSEYLREAQRDTTLDSEIAKKSLSTMSGVVFALIEPAPRIRIVEPEPRSPPLTMSRPARRP